MRALFAWLEHRAGLLSLLRFFAAEEVPGGARWSYVFGSVLLALFALQAVSGVVLMAYYSPSATQAWASVAFVQDQVWGGWLVRGLHHFGASAMIVVLGLHLAQVFLYGAYRAPREVNWLVGLLLLQIVMAFGLTGYLLPWDQKGFWATQVATNIIGTAPLVGPALQKVLVGGDYGSLTLTRFYALHALVLPATLVVLAVGHVLLFKRHKVTPAPWRSEAEVVARKETFWPRQALFDLAAALLAYGAVLALVLANRGAPLDAPADPASTYVARPEWYFLPLFQLLKYFEGPLEVVGTIVLPALAFGALAALPWLDRGHDRSLRGRLPVLAAGGAAALLVLGLGALAVVEDAGDPGIAVQRAESARRASVARALARKGLGPAGGLAALQDDPLETGRALFREHCAACHIAPTPDDRKVKGPLLHGLRSRARMVAFLQNPDDGRFFGNTGNKGEMKPPNATEEELMALATYLATFRGDPAEPEAAALGKAVYEREECIVCHVKDGEGTEFGPPHTGLYSDDWLVRLLEDPRAYYGKKSQMPSFAGKLSEKEMRAVVAYVLTL